MSDIWHLAGKEKGPECRVENYELSPKPDGPDLEDWHGKFQLGYVLRNPVDNYQFLKTLLCKIRRMSKSAKTQAEWLIKI